MSFSADNSQRTASAEASADNAGLRGQRQVSGGGRSLLHRDTVRCPLPADRYPVVGDRALLEDRRTKYDKTAVTLHLAGNHEAPVCICQCTGSACAGSPSTLAGTRNYRPHTQRGGYRRAD